jgi:hypothetical protein
MPCLDTTARRRPRVAASAFVLALAVGPAGCTKDNPEFGALLIAGGETDGGSTTATSEPGTSSTTSAGTSATASSSSSTAGSTSAATSSPSSTTDGSGSVSTSTTTDGGSSSVSTSTDTDTDASSVTTDATTDTGDDCLGGVEVREATVIADTFILSDPPMDPIGCMWPGGSAVANCSDLDFGLIDSFFVASGDQPAWMLVRFALDEIGLTETESVVGARLRVYAFNESIPTPSKLYAHPMRPEAAWIEGNGRGSAIETVKTTWNCMASANPMQCALWPGQSPTSDQAIGNFVGAHEFASEFVSDYVDVFLFDFVALEDALRDPAQPAIAFALIPSDNHPLGGLRLKTRDYDGPFAPLLEIDVCKSGF